MTINIPDFNEVNLVLLEKELEEIEYKETRVKDINEVNDLIKDKILVVMLIQEIKGISYIN